MQNRPNLLFRLRFPFHVNYALKNPEDSLIDLAPVRLRVHGIPADDRVSVCLHRCPESHLVQVLGVIEFCARIHTLPRVVIITSPDSLREAIRAQRYTETGLGFYKILR